MLYSYEYQTTHIYSYTFNLAIIIVPIDMYVCLAHLCICQIFISIYSAYVNKPSYALLLYTIAIYVETTYIFCCLYS